MKVMLFKRQVQVSGIHPNPLNPLPCVWAWYAGQAMIIRLHAH